MNQNDSAIYNLCKQVVYQNNYMLIDVAFRGQKNSKVIEVYIDRKEKLSVEDCALISREINELIEKENLISESYRLDVSSPGTDKPLKYLDQYYKHIGRNFEFSYKEENEDKKTKLKAKLVKIDGEDLYFIINNQETIINFKNLITAKVIPSFS